MIRKIFISSITACICFTCYSQNVNHYTQNEVKCVEVFKGFISYLKTKIKSKADISDSSSLKYVLVNYLFVDKKLDTTDLSHFRMDELSFDEFNNLKKEVFTFYRFLDEREDKLLAENLRAIPLRFSKDRWLYNHMTAFQKKNTFVCYDKRYPDNTLCYVLFVPPINKLITKPKIWSWTLMFKFGKFFFKSSIGEEGHEYLFGK